MRRIDPDELRRIYHDQDELDRNYDLLRQPTAVERWSKGVELFAYGVMGFAAIYFAIQFMRG